MDVVTGSILSQHFEQVLLISHSSAFDPALFPYHVYMDNGSIVESNLPVVETSNLVVEEEPYISLTDDNIAEDDMQDMTIRVPVVAATKVGVE